MGWCGGVGVVACGFVEWWGWLPGVVWFVVGCDWFHLLVWRMSWGFRCFGACVVGFGCGSVMIGVTPVFGCVCDTMWLCFMQSAA